MSKQPNIICITSDDTNHRMLGYCGGKVLSPNIDSIANNGVAFTEFHCASPACMPSRYNYLTGHYGGRCPSELFKNEIKEGDPYPLWFNMFLDSQEERSLGHALQQAGYNTGYVGKWHINASKEDLDAVPGFPHNPKTQKLMESKGLDTESEPNKMLRRQLRHDPVFFDSDADPKDPKMGKRLKEQQDKLCKIVRKNGFNYAERIIWSNHTSLMKKAAIHNIEWITKGALNFIDEYSQDDKPFFLTIAPTTIHGPSHVQALMSDPYLTGAGYSDEHIGCQASRGSIFARLNDTEGVEFNEITAGVLWMDDGVGAVLKRLKELGIEEDTVVIFSTDHGSATTGKFSLYQTGVHLPFAMQWKRNIKKGQVIDKLAQNVDLVPTLLDMAGAPVPEDMTVDGRSLLPFINGAEETKNGRDDLYFEWGYARAVRTKKWKYIAVRLPESVNENMKDGTIDTLCTHLSRPIVPDIINPDGLTMLLFSYPHYFAPDQLYDLENDPYERNNLAYDEEFSEVLKEMKGRLRKYLDTFDFPFDLDNPDDFYFSERFKKLEARIKEKFKKEEAIIGKWCRQWSDGFHKV